MDYRELLKQALEALELVDEGAWSKLTIAIRKELETPEQEPHFKDVDVEWLRSVLRHADKNPDYFPEVRAGKYTLDGDSAEVIAELLRSSQERRMKMNWNSTAYCSLCGILCRTYGDTTTPYICDGCKARGYATPWKGLRK